MSVDITTQIVRKSDKLQFNMLSGDRCIKCGEISKNIGYLTCYSCGFKMQLEYIDGCIFFGYYDQKNHSTLLSKELLDCKTDPSFAKGLSDLLEIAYKKHNIEVDILTFVPLRLGKDTKNNPPKFISRFLGNRINKKVYDLLKYNRVTNKMTELDSREERIKNVTDAIVLNQNISLTDIRIGVVDDIFTTGSTINECAKVLRNAGAKSVYGICVGRSLPGYESGYLC